MSLIPVLVAFIFGAVVLGAGGMLAPALPALLTPIRQQAAPRIGLAAGLALAIVLTGALFLAALFGWDTLTIDYLWFALLVGVFLTGALARGTRRGEAAGLRDGQLGWPGVRELVLFAVVLAAFVAPVLVLPVPLDTDAQGFGYLALTLRDSGSLTTLAPFHPEVEYLYSPGFLALVAYLSRQLGVGIHVIQFVVAAVLALVFIWLLYDLGNEAEDWLDPATRAGDPRPERHAGVTLALMGVLGLGLFTAYMDSHFTTVLALVFSLAFLLFIVRYLRGSRWQDVLAAAVCLGALPLTHPDTTIILVLGYGPWLLLLPFARPRPTWGQWMVIAVVVPGLAVLSILPWLAQIAPLLGGSIASPFAISGQHWKVLVFMHGGLIVPLALGGALLALRRRSPLDLLMLGWLVLLVDFSTTGVLAALMPWLPLLKYDYPFSIAWHGPIIPYAYLAAQGVLWLAGRIGWSRVRRWTNRYAWPALIVAALGIVIGVAASGEILRLSKGRIAFYGAFSSHADVEAMTWLRDNTPPETRILNHPASQEGDWVPVITERDTVFFRPQPFFQHTARVEAEQAALAGFWEHPADLVWLDRLRAYEVDYVLVPQVVGDPASFGTMWRWREPFAWGITMREPVSDAPYLELVADFDGARIYRVVGLRE